MTSNSEPEGTFMSRNLLPALVLVCAVALLQASQAMPAFASPETQEAPVSIDLVDAGAKAVLRTFGTMADAEVVIDEGIEGELTILLNDVHWMTAMDAVCESVGCRWSLEGGFPRQLRFRKEEWKPAGPEESTRLSEPLTLSLRDAEVRQVLKSFGKILQREVVFAQPVKGTVSFELNNVTLRTALTAVCQSARCRWELVDERILISETVRREQASEARERLQRPLTLSLAEAPIKAVLDSYAKILGVSLRLAPGVAGNVTVELQDVAAEKALDEVCTMAQCRWRLEGDGQGETTLVVEPAER